METISYKLMRSNRKTISLQITRDLQVIVRGPRRMSREQADRFIQQHMDWLEKHMKRLEKRVAEQAAFDYSSGQSIYFRGQPYIIATAGVQKAIVSGETLLIPEIVTEREKSVMEFLRHEAEKRLPTLTEQWAERMGLDSPKVKITSAKTRWGSCNGRDSVNYSLRMSCLPPALEEYVIVHELCHLQEHNHSPAFHALVERFLPHQKRLREELREFQKKLFCVIN